MPFPRGRKPTAAAGSKIPKLNATAFENQDATQVKRSSSPPRGAPKKRTAFIDITNVSTFFFLFFFKGCDLGFNSRIRASISTQRDIFIAKMVHQESGLNFLTVDVTFLVSFSFHPSMQIPKEFDIDSENSEDCYMCPEYAKDIFDYLKNREEKFVLCNYMPTQPSLNSEMRAILIDWLVEVQENFELYHETLYLAVKMTDHYLAKTPVHREMLQLVGSTAMLVASKFEEHSPPCVDDFLYICDDAYKREELISMEESILQTLSFDINIPIPYRFLRRYAKCVSASMDTLTLARYYCEMSLMEMDLVPARGSLVASACLLMALVTKDLGGWSPILQFHSGYQASDLAPVVRRIYSMLSAPPDDKLRAIKNKYSHKVFFEVASLPLLSIDILEKALSS
uniref:G2/mitotic-specific cyclin-B2 n=1 Tax=Maylandia zebra TaxID=106582 RepID=A0A3P9CY49_9CICH